MNDNDKDFNQFVNNKYINIESYKKNGMSVRTPVLFVNKEQKIYFRTSKSSGKIKRINNNAQIKFAPCNINGKTNDNYWKSGLATIINGSEIEIIDKLFEKKYGIINMLLKLIYKIRKMELVFVSVSISNDT